MHGDKIEFDGTPENLANFIMHNKNNAVVITDAMDQFVVSSTQGGFLDRVAYPALREENLEKILPLQLGDKQSIDVAHQDVQRDPIEELARDLDDFAFDYDFYGCQDVIDDRTEHIEMLVSQLQTGNVEDLKDFLKEIIEEGTYMAPEASALLGRVETIKPPTKEKVSIMESLKQAKKETQEQIIKPKDIIKDKDASHDDI